ncbi:chromosome partitioning protein ParA [Vibrio sp.]|uniref:Chromosome partitioning protein ParA n=1 Tax=Vibrio viridaestus TaxID=2487322 RepID=A0A3N9TI29_9VIBR|nr:chromosome partitioning protein ParA [Vibrio viridaestus]MDC0611547.1 chromosome partitioning protein ParA [Vibrio sp.]RQW63185.1 chromosome partitioning protein ParA [Vibrio viridaestus]
MVSINGLPPSSGLSRTNKASRSKKSHDAQTSSSEASSSTQPTRVASAVSQSLRTMNEAEIEGNRIQYDLPEGKSRRALEEYYAIYNQAKRDELAQMLGVDIYI